MLRFSLHRAVKSLATSSRSSGGFGAPTPRAALEHVAVMENAIEHGGHRRHIAQQFSPVLHGAVGSQQRAGALARS